MLQDNINSGVTLSDELKEKQSLYAGLTEEYRPIELAKRQETQVHRAKKQQLSQAMQPLETELQKYEEQLKELRHDQQIHAAKQEEQNQVNLKIQEFQDQITELESLISNEKKINLKEKDIENLRSEIKGKENLYSGNIVEINQMQYELNRIREEE